MNDQVANDFHAALLAIQEVKADPGIENDTEAKTALLVDEVFAFLDAFTPEHRVTFEPIERIAA